MDQDFPQTINGILFESKEEYDQRIKTDAEQMAHFLFSLYQQKKLSTKDLES